MATSLYDAAEAAGYEPFLVCNSLDNEQDIRLKNILRGDWTREVKRTTIDKMTLIKIPRYLPEFEFLQYILNGSHWKEQIRKADVHIGVGGSNHCCYPFVRENCQFGCWTATLYWDDRKDRIQEQSIFWKIREHVSRPLLEQMESRIYKNAYGIYVLSEYTANQILQYYNINRDRISVVPFPINIDKFSPNGNIKNSIESEPTVLFTGRFTDPRKNIYLLIHAFALVLENVPDAKLLLVGDKPGRDITSLIESLSIQEKVRFIDFVSHDALPAYYRSSDVFAIPSKQEGLCIAGLEAMACGLPVVSTRCGGPEEYVHNGKNGYLVQNDKIEPLAQRISELLQDDHIRYEMGLKARELVESRYETEKVKGQLVSMLEDIR